MRISTANTYNITVDTIMSRQASLSGAQAQMTSGKRLNRASDDPAAMGRAERALVAEARATANQRAVDASDNAMTLTESALADAGDLLQRAREGLVAAGNASYTDSDRASIADELAALRMQLFAVANRTDGAGTFVFGGQGTNQAPFVDAAGGVQFQGTNGAVQAASGEALPLTMDGESTWLQARTGNGVFETRALSSAGTAWVDRGTVSNPAALTGATYQINFSVAAGATTFSVLKNGVPTAQTNVAFTPGQAVQVDGMSATFTGQPANGDAFELAPSTPTLSVFDTLDKAIADLRSPARTATAITQTNAVNLSNLDQVLNQTLAGRTQIGAVMSRIDNVTSRLSATKLSSQTERSKAEDLDMVHAISDFSNQQTGYDAALKAYSMVQRLSLFTYLSP